MLEHLPAEVRAGIDAARKRAHRQGRRLRLEVNGAIFPILRLWDDGLALDPARVTRLRGFVEIHEGSRLIATGLIVASQVENDELICTFKRLTQAHDRAAADYELGAFVPAGLIGKG